MLRKLGWILLGMAVALSACAPRWTDVKSTPAWRDGVFYEIFVRSFADSDGDGDGDLKGILEHLDYLNDGDAKTKTDLGVTGLWLMPIFDSPSYHGYDVKDFTAVNPDYGTLDDLKALLAEAHKRGMVVILDLPLNHTSTQNAWFEAANAGDPAYRDWYIWQDKNPGYKGPWGEDVWHAGKTGYYYGVFVASMPDLNYENPAVTAESRKIADFWLKDVGIDGFRMDGVKHMLEDGQAQENTPATHAWLKEFNAYVKSVKSDSLVVGEVWSGTSEIAAYVNADELDLAFNFPMADDFMASALGRSAYRAMNSLAGTARALDDGKTLAPFLTNHDQPRVATALLGDGVRQRAAAAMLLSAPGVPFLYYGEEIGMSGGKPDEKIRKPMQWNTEENAGFSTGTPWIFANEDYKTVNVAAQSADPSSLLAWYRDLIRVRSEHYALRSGTSVPVTVESVAAGDASALYASLRVAEQEAVLVLINLDDEAIEQPALGWSNSALKGGGWKAYALMGKPSTTAPALDEKGGVKAYTPLTTIAPGEAVMIQYRR